MRNGKTNSRPSEIEVVATLIQDLGKPVLMLGEFQSLLRRSLPKGLRTKVAEKLLHENGIIRRRTLKSNDYKDVERIAVQPLNPTPYDYAISLRGEAYLSHGTAVHLLGLTQQQPKTIYVNREQSTKPTPQTPISQESIDRAFSRPQRRSNYAYRIDTFQIVLLSGKATGRAGVIRDESTGLPMTCLERTLIDITVRPRYAGGVFQVSQAFKVALAEIDASKLLSLLGTLDHRYPYHQAIGFYLERAGAEKRTLNQLRDQGLQFDFYLDYAMSGAQFDDSWKVFYPLGV